MKRITLIFGLVLGALLCINMFYAVYLCYEKPDFRGNDVIGYTIMVVIFSTTFFGIRNYRNKQLNGYISFGKAFKTGALIALVGATLYVVIWLFFYYLFVPDFEQVYAAKVLKDAAAGGPAELAVKTKSMDMVKQLYKNPVTIALLTYTEVLPVGLVVALISALVLKRKNKTISNP